MAYQYYKKILDVICKSSNTQINELFTHVNTLQQLNKAIAQYFSKNHPIESSKYNIRVANLTDNNTTLILASCNSQLKYLLHFWKPDILKYINKTHLGKNIKNIKLTVDFQDISQSLNQNYQNYQNLVPGQPLSSNSNYNGYNKEEFKTKPASEKTANKIINTIEDKSLNIFSNKNLANSIKKLFKLSIDRQFNN